MLLYSLIQNVVAFALPPRCAACGEIAARDHVFCVDCWKGLSFLPDLGCPSCNRPMPITETICGPCLQTPPVHDGVRAAVAYGAVSRTLVLKLKHGRRPAIARTIARYLQPHLINLEDAIFAPVPLHRRRIWSRGFNQSNAIARSLPLAPDQHLVPDLLERFRPTPMLAGLGRRERERAVKGAFRLNPRWNAPIKGKTIVLVDDVYTSGATINACAKILKRAGAQRVIALCWARVISADDQQY